MPVTSVRWGAGRKDAFTGWLDDELTDALAEHQKLVECWMRWLEQYRAPANRPLKNFPFEGAPLARDTEILTRSGWRRIDTICIGEDVLTRRDDTGVMEWKPVRALPRIFSQKLHHFKSRAMDLLVTPEHTMLAEPQGKRGVVRRMPAKVLWETTGYYLPQHGIWHGNDHERRFGLDAGDVAEFIGWYLAEGSIRLTNDNRNRHAVVISQSSVNADKCERIEALLTRLHFNWKRYGADYLVFHGSMPTPLFDLLASERGATRKRVPRECFDWSAGLIDRLLMGMMLGDGCIHHLSPNYTPKADYYTVSRGLADDVQVLATLCGLHARVRVSRKAGVDGGTIRGRQITSKNDCYVVALCATPRAKYDRAKYEIVDYNDVAFCVTVENHAIYARRNGKASWTGNSNVELPKTATAVDQLFAKFVQTIHASDTLWTLEPLNERWVNAAKPLQDFLTWLDANRLHMLPVNKKVFLEMVKLGTGLYKHGWLHRQTPTYVYDEHGTAVRGLKTEGTPFVDHVRLADFVIPPYAWNIQPDEQGGAPWVAERLRVPQLTLRQWATSSEPLLPNFSKPDIEAILHFEEASETDYDTARQTQDYDKRARATPGVDFTTDRAPASVSGGQPAPSRRKRDIELWEVHARYPTADDRGVDDVIVWYHRPTRRIVRAVYQYYLHGKRPYEAVRYFPGEGFYGIGVCEQNEVFQRLASDLFNFQHDNVLLANSRMIVAQSGANITPGEPIYPGKIWITDGPINQSFGVFPMADLYPSIYQIQSQIEFAGEKRNGIGDLQTGQIENLPGRTPATTTLSLLQEGNRRPDLTVKDIRDGLSTVGLRLLQLCQQYMGRQTEEVGGQALLELAVTALGTPEGGYAAEKLTTPLENAEIGLGVTLTATTGQSNKEVARQNYLSLIQIATQLSQQFLQLTQVMMQFPGSPMAAVAQQASIGLAELGNRLLEQYDIRNPEKILPLTLDPQSAPILPLGLGGLPAGAQPGAGGVPGGAGFDPTMAALTGGVAQGL